MMKKEIPIWADAKTLGEIERRFGYVLRKLEAGSSFYKPTVEAHEITGPFQAAGLAVRPFEQDHGFSKTLGYRIGKFAYSTDVVELDERAFAALEGVEVWIVDCLRREPHPTHSHLENTLRWIGRVRPARAILTHMDPVLDYETLRAELPDGVEPGYDGLTFDLT